MLPPDSLLSERLRRALAAEDHTLPEGAAQTVLETVREQLSDPVVAALALMDDGLSAQGVTLAPAVLTRVGRALLGVTDPPTRPSLSQLSALSELHDLSRPGEVAPLVRLLAGESELEGDLRRARPWLAADLTDAEAVLTGIFEGEWWGFVARVGVAGPWVYAAGVADLQALSREYGTLLELARAARPADLLDVALRQTLLATAAPTLLARLSAAELPPVPRGRAVPRARGTVSAVVGAATLLAAEDAYWRSAKAQARRRTERWAARRRE